MYHISNDRRSKRSAELIYQGLLTCLNTKPFEDITVTDLQKASGVARTTIYRSFDNLSDILYWRCDLSFQQALPSPDAAAFPSDTELAWHYFSYWLENSDILKLLLDINRHDIIYACHLKHAKELERSFGTLPNLDETNARYFIAIRTGITVGVLKAWLDGGRKETTEEMLRILEHQLVYLKNGI